MEYIFWTWNQNYGEPDLILIFRDHVYGLDDLLLVVEAKFKYSLPLVSITDDEILMEKIIKPLKKL